MGRPLSSKNKVVVAAPLPPPSREEKIKSVMYKFKWDIERADKIRAKIAEDMAKTNYSAVYAVEWLQDKVRPMHLGAVYNSVMEIINDTNDVRTLEEKLKGTISWLEGQVENWYPQNSTSPYSNAASNEKFLANKEALKEIRAAYNYLTKADEILV